MSGTRTIKWTRRGLQTSFSGTLIGDVWMTHSVNLSSKGSFKILKGILDRTSTSLQPTGWARWLAQVIISWGKRNRNLGPLRDYETFFFKWRRFPHLRILVILGVVLSLTYNYSISEHILSISYRNYIHYMNVRNSVSLSLSRPHDSILQTKSMNLWCILWSIFKSNLSCFNSRSLHFMTTWPRHNR